ncbi:MULTISPECIES: hypothetical protein [unclassified Brevundimonas]|uniref:hypothetical protein n=1 Tax=unclassified Brevundimonas TaxID=2622653 RepID=UPI001FD7D783|nr:MULTISPECIES: hypothetical protein [unclassified Brevundimonas]
MTFALLIAALALAGFSGWRGAREPDPLRGPRLVPWRFLMLLSAALALLLLIHAARLAVGAE